MKEPQRFGVDIRVGSPAEARFLGYQNSRSIEHYPALCGEKDGDQVPVRVVDSHVCRQDGTIRHFVLEEVAAQGKA